MTFPLETCRFSLDGQFENLNKEQNIEVNRGEMFEEIFSYNAEKGLIIVTLCLVFYWVSIKTRRCRFYVDHPWFYLTNALQEETREKMMNLSQEAYKGECKNPLCNSDCKNGCKGHFLVFNDESKRYDRKPLLSVLQKEGSAEKHIESTHPKSSVLPSFEYVRSNPPPKELKSS